MVRITGMRRYLTINEVAAILHCTPTQVRALVEENTLYAHCRPGREMRFCPDQVQYARARLQRRSATA